MMTAETSSSIAAQLTLGRAGTAPAAPQSLQRIYPLVLAATAVFLASLVYYGVCLFPGLGGEINAGDSAKFQILGHTSIMVHGPGYPLVLLLGAGLRALDLPVPAWWALAFTLSAVPAALANALALLIVQRLTRSIVFGFAAALLLGSAGLVAIQATEAEVYALTLAFVLATIYLLVLFVETERLGFLLAASAVYALSFGNHLMMIMFLPVFLWLAVLHRRAVLRPHPVAMILAFILLGASQYLYLAHVAYDPKTAYSEYMPLPPAPAALIRYILGTYLTDLYESGVPTLRGLEAMVRTLRSAHPWLSMPLIAGGILLFLAAWKRRDEGWRGLAMLYGGALSFLPFTLAYGAPDIEAFHLPVLGPLLLAAVATPGWWLRRHAAVGNAVALLLVVVGLARAAQTAEVLSAREPLFDGLKPVIRMMVAQSPVAMPIVAMAYDLRMVALYHELRGELPAPAIYRLHWRAVAEVRDQHRVGGIVVATEGYQFVRWIEYRRPDMRCSTRKLDLPEGTRWPAYAFECRSGPTNPAEPAPAAAPIPGLPGARR